MKSSVFAGLFLLFTVVNVAHTASTQNDYIECISSSLVGPVGMTYKQAQLAVTLISIGHYLKPEFCEFDTSRNINLLAVRKLHDLAPFTHGSGWNEKSMTIQNAVACGYGSIWQAYEVNRDAVHLKVSAAIQHCDKELLGSEF